MNLRKYLLWGMIPLYFFIGCTEINLFEKNVSIPQRKWDTAFKPEIKFVITDTLGYYNIYFVIRHDEAYNFNNIWVNIKSKSPGDSAFTSQQFDFPLATENRWTGTGMDDLYEHRILLYPQPVKFRHTGLYEVLIEQVMRENPLLHVLNVGIRVEKVKPL